MSDPTSATATPEIGFEVGANASLYAEEEKTQPTEEILNALRQLSESSFATPPSAVQNSNGHIPSNGTVSQEIKEEPKQEPESALPPRTEWDATRAHLGQKRYDVDAWQKLVDLAEESGDIEKIRQTYDALLEAYPNTSSAQIAYLTHFLDNPERGQEAVNLFKKFLNKSPSVELWKFYLTYIRRINVGPQAYETIKTSYEFALNRIGQDKDSTQIWLDYIQFLKAGETHNTWEEQQKMDLVRKAYHRAVQIPMENVKKLWEDYQEFENNLNKITAKKFLSDLQEGHMQARTVLNQLQEHLTVLFPPPPPSRSGRPPIWLPRQPTFSPGDKALVGRWRLYLKWEESNPLEIEEKDKSTLITRIQGMYRKALVRMRFFSEIWYMAYVWTQSIGRADEAVQILRSGIDANVSSFVLNFAYAESLETQGKFDEVHAAFEKFLEVLRTDLEELESKVLASSNGSPTSSQQTQPDASATQPGSTPPGTQAQALFSSQSLDEKPSKPKELIDRRTDYGIAWIVYMRFARRAEGLKSSRSIFAKARKDKWTPWEVYEAAALMEYHCTKALDVAGRIFEMGLKLFGDEVEFVLRYLGFLISVNDENNARALFERVITTFPPERARPLWDRWARYEYQFGDLAAAQKLEKRIAEAYPQDSHIKRFAERHKYLGTDPIAVRDLGFVITRPPPQGSSRGSMNGFARTDTQQSLTSQPSQPQPAAGASTSKRASSPDHRRRDEGRAPDYGPPSKRARPASPPRDRDRDRWEGPPRGRRHGTPPWERDRDRDSSFGRRSFIKEELREEEKPVLLPPVLSWFVGQLPAPASFDGPVFRVDDLMQVFRNAVIPSSTSRARSPPPPPPPRGGGRPPPDYGPYQGPGPRRGRY